MLTQKLENIALDSLLENILAPAVRALKADPKKLRFLVQSNANRSRVVLNGERFRYEVRNQEHILTSERRVLGTQAGSKEPAVTLTLKNNTVTFVNQVAGRVTTSNASSAKIIFSELQEVAFH